jgi:carboxyl-terminal processing protease
MRLKSKRLDRSWLRSLRNLLILTLFLVLGINIGNGTLALHHHATNGQLPAKLDYSSVQKVYDSLKQNYDGKLTETQLEDGLKHGLAEATHDPYTVYFTAKEAKDFNDELNNSFSGIGAQLGQDKDGNLEVIAPIDGLPAAKAGLKAKDIIAEINGASTSGMSVDEAVSKIRGKSGTSVKLQIIRDRSQTINLTVTRQDINLPSVKTKTLDGNIGYIQISTFAKDTTDLTQKAAQSLKDQNVKGIVLDLRDDPGGLLDAAVNVSSLWLPGGTKVLINSGSASASEITAGALHDNKAAYLIGEKSYGKGVVQQLINFRDDSQLKVTIASWYRPDGENINHKGITPDKVIKISDTDAAAGNDTQLQAAQAYLANKQ